MSGAHARAEACFRLASHPATPTHEAAAALERGWGIINRHGLDPDRFEIPGRERAVDPEADIDLGPVPPPRWADDGTFGTFCVGCGLRVAIGAMCLHCYRAARDATCAHGQHGACLTCMGMTHDGH